MVFNQLERAKFSVYILKENTTCGSRKYPYPPQGRSLEIPRGKGVSKCKLFKGKYEQMKLNWKFLGGGGFKPKQIMWGRYGYFLEPHNLEVPD